MAEHPGRVDLLLRKEKAGRGAAVIAAFKKGLADPRGYAVFLEMDADFSHHPRELPKFLAKLETCDMVVGSRYVEGGGTSEWGFWRPLLSWLANKYIALVAGVPIRDTTSGFRAYRRAVLEETEFDRIKIRGYVVHGEMAYQAWVHGFRLGEVPIHFKNRARAASKLSGEEIYMALLNFALLRFRYGFRPRKRAPGPDTPETAGGSSSGAGARPDRPASATARGRRSSAGRAPTVSPLERAGVPFRAVEDLLGPEGLAAADAAARTWARVWGRLPLVDGKSFRELVEWRGSLSPLERGGLPARGDGRPALRADGRDRAAPPRDDRPLRGGRAGPRPRRRAPPRRASHRARRALPRPGAGARGGPSRPGPTVAGAACGGRSPACSRPPRHRRCRRRRRGRDWTPLPSSPSSRRAKTAALSPRSSEASPRTSGGVSSR